MAASDRALIEAAAREAGALMRGAFGTGVTAEWKDDSSPVTALDREIDAMLRARLQGARPDYGWLSEETADDSLRLGKQRVFIVDPLDGTRAFLAGRPEFCVAIAIVEDEIPTHGAVYNPITDEMFLASPGEGATRNGDRIEPTARAELEGACLVGNKEVYADKRWPAPWPANLRFGWANAISYRIAMIAAGRCDAALMLGWRYEWDLAAAVAVLHAAGGRASDMYGRPLPFNQPDPRTPGAIASGGPLHPILIERVKHVPHPREWEARAAAARAEAMNAEKKAP